MDLRNVSVAKLFVPPLQYAVFFFFFLECFCLCLCFLCVFVITGLMWNHFSGLTCSLSALRVKLWLFEPQEMILAKILGAQHVTMTTRHLPSNTSQYMGVGESMADFWESADSRVVSDLPKVSVSLWKLKLLNLNSCWEMVEKCQGSYQHTLGWASSSLGRVVGRLKNNCWIVQSLATYPSMAFSQPALPMQCFRQ